MVANGRPDRDDAASYRYRNGEPAVGIYRSAWWRQALTQNPPDRKISPPWSSARLASFCQPATYDRFTLVLRAAGIAPYVSSRTPRRLFRSMCGATKDRRRSEVEKMAGARLWPKP